MDIIQSLLEIAKYIIPALVVLIATNLIVGKFIQGENRRKHLEIYKSGMETTVRLRLQAYERLSLFLERIHPRLLVSRVYEPGMKARDLQMAILTTIRKEFEHNLSQQIYVSQNLWKTIINVKEQEMAMMNQISASINPESSAKELQKRIIEAVMEMDVFPIEVALEMINNEAKLVLSHQS